MSDETQPAEAPGGANVVPIVQTHVCSSCKQTIQTRLVYEGHGPTCMQPEVRFRRTEMRLYILERVIANMPGFSAQLVQDAEEGL